MAGRVALALLCVSAGAALAAAGCEPTIIYIEEPTASTTSSTTTSASSSASGNMGGAGGAMVCVPGTMKSCYSGPPESEGQGICKAGMQVCAPDGASFGPCTGEVLPEPTDDCATPLDEDCDGLAPSCKGDLLWAEQLSTANNTLAADIAVDATGNVVVVGVNVIGAPGGPGATVFVVKFDATGTLLWSRTFGGPSAAVGAGKIAADPSGAVVMMGRFSGMVDFGGGVLTSKSEEDLYVLKLTADGEFLWVKSYGEPSASTATGGLAVDSSGQIILAGSFQGSFSFGGPVLTSAGMQDIFVAKLDSSGAHVWSRKFGDSLAQTARGVALDAGGNVLLIGGFSGALDFGGGTLTSAGGTDVFIAKLDPGGAHLWSSRYGDSQDQLGNALAVDTAGRVLVTGTFDGAIDFNGSAPLVSAGQDVFVAKLESDGAHVWSKRFGAAGDQTSAGIAADSTGNTLVTGRFAGSVNFGGGELVSAGGQDAFLVKLDGGGSHLWSRRFGDSSYQAGSAVGVAASGSVLIGGTMSGSVDFGGQVLMASGAQDTFVAAFGP